MLRALGFNDPHATTSYEGDAALLGIFRLPSRYRREPAKQQDPSRRDTIAIAQVQRARVFTTHTPVEAGHDRFAIGLVRRIREISSSSSGCAASRALIV